MMIVIRPEGKTKILRKASEKWRPECLGYVAHGPKSTLKIMVWGCITYQGIGNLAFIDGNINSEKYIKTLDDNVWQVVAKNYGVNTWLFQDNNAPLPQVTSLRGMETQISNTTTWLARTVPQFISKRKCMAVIEKYY